MTVSSVTSAEGSRPETASAFNVNVPGGSLRVGDYVTVNATANGETSALLGRGGVVAGRWISEKSQKATGTDLVGDCMLYGCDLLSRVPGG